MFEYCRGGSRVWKEGLESSDGIALKGCDDPEDGDA